MANTRNRRTAASSGVALAAVMLGAPALAAPAPAAAVDQAPAPAARSSGYEKQISATRSAGWIKFHSDHKLLDEYSVAGVDGGHIVFEDERGQLFYVDDTTGDQKFVSRTATVKHHKDWIDARTWPHKMMSPVHIVGLDQDGRTIMSNPTGENFYLDAVTGDMIFVKK